METIFGQWAIANIFNDISKNGRLGYYRQGLRSLHVPTTQSIALLEENVQISFTDAIKDWQTFWYRIESFGPSTQGKNHLQLSFDSTSVASFRVAYLIENIDGTIEYKNKRLRYNKPIIQIPNVDQVSRVTWVPYKTDKLSGFTNNEPTIALTTRIERVANTDESLISTPEDYNLTEGDFIRAEGDKDVYIINQYMYKRLVLSPEICLQYGHLGKRGCFEAVKIVTQEVRDMFTTSHYYTNGETNDNIIYQMIITGEDSATLQQIDRQMFLQNGNTEQQIFLFNTLEQQSYN
jgi:hypothetical protein